MTVLTVAPTNPASSYSISSSFEVELTYLPKLPTSHQPTWERWMRPALCSWYSSHNRQERPDLYLSVK